MSFEARRQRPDEIRQASDADERGRACPEAEPDQGPMEIELQEKPNTLDFPSANLRKAQARSKYARGDPADCSLPATHT